MNNSMFILVTHIIIKIGPKMELDEVLHRLYYLHIILIMQLF